MASRNTERCNEAVNKIKESNNEADIEVMKVDLGSLESIKNFVIEYTSKYDRIDVLLNNAGVMFTPAMKTVDGFEFQNGINHLGHFALTAQLLPLIKKTKDSRIVNVSSMAHTWGSMDWNDYMFEKDYNSRASYGRSKLSNLLYTYELNRRLKKEGLDTKVLSSSPWWFKHKSFQIYEW